MIETVAPFCLVLLSISMLLPLYRIVRGPSMPDRAVGADALTTHVMAIVVIASIASATRVYMDAVMALAVLGFFGTVAVAKYIQEGKAID
ncbi:MAG: multicomponent Na+:H+ antiporter subunit F [Hyphomicrobiaceae bacterium]|jgi:multicomponent Na+:H+ antiporter subunit F